MNKCHFAYVLLSLAFIVANWFTLSRLMPWIDEVMMLDTAYNTAFHGRWETTAWYRVVGEYPFSTYPPLYQMLAAVWMWLFGSSLWVVRSMNLLTTFLLGGVCLRMMERRGLAMSVWPTLLFTLLLWGTGEMAWMYRNGRPDILCALLATATVLAAHRHLEQPSPSARIALVAASAALVCSGLQTVVWIWALWAFCFMARRGWRRQLIQLFPMMLTGITLGLLALALFMLAHGRLLAFVSSIVQYSATLSGIALTVIPWAGDLFGFDATPCTQKLLELTAGMSLGGQLLSMAAYRSFLVLWVVTLAAYVTRFRKSLHRLFSDDGFLMLLFALCAPVMMALAGRFPDYYRWMAFLPLLVSVTSIAVRSRGWCAVCCVAAFAVSASGVKTVLTDDKDDYGNLQTFVGRQGFKKSDVVVCPFSLFYEIKPLCDTCYFAGIFPAEYISHADYIVEASGGDAYDKPLSAYIGMLKADTSLAVTAIDSCDHPSLTLYQVSKKP